MEPLDTSLVPTIAAFVVGAVVGAATERWLLVRCMTNVLWVARRMRWLWGEDRTAARLSADVGALALNSWRINLFWLIHRGRLAIALLSLAALVGAGLALLR